MMQGEPRRADDEAHEQPRRSDRREEVALMRRMPANVVEVLVLAPVVAFAALDLFYTSPARMPVLLAAADAALVLPLLARRARPRAAFWAIFAVAVALAPWNYRLTGSIALAVALYTLASRRPERDVAPAVAALAVALLGVSLTVGGTWYTTFPSLLAVLVAVTVLGLWVRARRELLTRLRGDAVRLRRERDQQADLAAAAERARIARELHDIVAHHLTVVVALADGAARAWQPAGGHVSGGGDGCAADPSARDDALDAVRAIAATGRQALADTRALVGVLGSAGGHPARPRVGDHAPTAPQPGLSQLEALVAMTRRAGLQVTLTRATVMPQDVATVPASAQLAAYRTVQEGLTNALRHAGPGAHVHVQVTLGVDAVVVGVSDDGAGELATRAPATGLAGHGLTGLRERVTALGGRLDAGPAPGPGAKGWCLDARIPLGTAP